jgi:phospholipid/cholesterol/gamma-HCH transport system substrate-binding protein
MPEDTKPATQRNNAVLIVLVAGGILGVLVLLFATVSGYNPFTRKITVTTYFINSLSLKSGAAVNLDGVTVGIVKKVALSTAPEHRKTPVEVTMSLDRKYLSGLHADSLAQLTSMGALADTFIDIDSQHATGPPLRNGDQLPTLNTPTVLNLNAVQQTTEDLHTFTDRLNKLADEAESGKGSIGQLLSNPGLTHEAALTAAKVHRVATKLARTDSTAGKLINDHSLAGKLASIGTTMQSLKTSSARFTGGPLQANFAAVQTQASSLAADVRAGHGALGMMTNDPAFKAQLTGTAAQAKAAIASIHTGNGIVPKMLSSDGAIDLRLLQTQSSTLATMIRQNPKKYLTIEVRLF